MRLLRDILFRFLICGLALSACTSVRGVNSDQVTITFGSFGAFEGHYEAIIEEFEQQFPGIRVQYVSIDDVLSSTTPDYTQLASLADIFILPVRPQGAEVFYFLDLQYISDRDPSFDPGAFWPGALQGCQEEGRLTGLPLTVSPLLVFFLKPAFEQLDLAYPTPGWNWQEFTNVAETLATRSDGHTVQYGFTDHGQPMALLAPAVDTILNQSGNSYSALVESLHWYVALGKSGAMPEDIRTSISDNRIDYVSERRVGMWVDSLSSLTQLRQDFDETVGVAPFPVLMGGSSAHSSIVGATCGIISAGTLYPEQAWTFLNYLTTRSSPAIQEISSIPARITVAEGSASWQKLDEATRAAIRFSLEHAWYGSISQQPFTAISAAINQAIAGNRPLIDILVSMQVALERTPLPTPQITPVPVNTPQPTTMPITNSDDRVEVNFFVSSPYMASLEVLKPIAAAFTQENPNILIQLEDFNSAGLSYADFNFLAENFDCFAESSVMSELLASQLYSLEPLLEVDPDREVLLADVPESQLDLSRFNGDLYGLPSASRIDVLYFNKDIFLEAGLEYPAIAWTVDDFWELAVKLSEDSIYGFAPLDGRRFVDLLLQEQGVELYYLDINNPEVSFTDPETLNVLLKLSEMSRNGVVPPIAIPTIFGGDNLEARLSAIHQGKAAMWINSAGLEYGDYFPPAGPNFEVGAAVLPNIGRPLGPDYTGVSLYISRQADDPHACWEWNKFLTTHAEAFNGIPVRSSILTSSEYTNIVGMDRAMTYRQAILQPREAPALVTNDVTLASYPLYMWWPAVITSATSGGDPVQAANQVQQRALRYLDCLSLASDPQQQETWVSCAQQVDPSFDIEIRD